MYECEQGCSKCCGPKAFIALTNNRIIARHQEADCCSCCCSCCCKAPHVDTAIYLRDIEVLAESKGATTGLCGALLVACMSGTLPCFLIALCCASCCGSCCGDVPKYIGVKGGFGTEVLTFKRPDAIQAANELSAMIQPFKERR